jgi:hypothetical protein
MRLILLVFAVVAILLSSCGIGLSTSSINRAEAKRENAFSKIVYVFGDDGIVETDDFGNKSLVRSAADNVFPLERRRAAYYFFKAEAYLAKAYEFRSRSRYDDARHLAAKADEFYEEALKIIEDAKPEKKVDAPVAAEPEKKEEVADTVPVKVDEEKTQPSPEKIEELQKPEVKTETVPEKQPAPVEKKAEPLVEQKPEAEEKVILKGDPFGEKKEEPKPEPAKEEKQPSYYDVYEEMRQKYLQKQQEQKVKEEKAVKADESKKEPEDKAKPKKEKKEKKAPEGGAK